MQGSFPVSNSGLAAAFDFLEAQLGDLGFGKTVVHRFSVILDELCANMINHDATLSDQNRFTVELSAVGCTARMIISDPGAPFDPLLQNTDIMREIGGQGIKLVRGLASDLRYERVGECNRLTVEIAPTLDRTARPG